MYSSIQMLLLDLDPCTSFYCKRKVKKIKICVDRTIVARSVCRRSQIVALSRDGLHAKQSPQPSNLWEQPSCWSKAIFYTQDLLKLLFCSATQVLRCVDRIRICELSSHLKCGPSSADGKKQELKRKMPQYFQKPENALKRANGKLI